MTYNKIIPCITLFFALTIQASAMHEDLDNFGGRLREPEGVCEILEEYVKKHWENSCATNEPGEVIIPTEKEMLFLSRDIKKDLKLTYLKNAKYSLDNWQIVFVPTKDSDPLNDICKWNVYNSGHSNDFKALNYGERGLIGTIELVERNN